MALKTYHRRPSEDVVDDDTPMPDIVAWCVDDAVLWFGLTIENLLAERREVQVGKIKQSQKVYTLEQLLDNDFRPPRPQAAPRIQVNPWQPLLDLVGKPRGGVKAYKYVGPMPTQPS